MYYRFGHDLSESADDILKSFELKIEQILIAHSERRLVIHLTRNEVARIRTSLKLGATAELALSAIQRRSDDIRAGMKAASRRLVLEPDSKMATPFSIKSNGDVHVKISGMFNNHYSHAQNVLVEHIENDRHAIEFIFRMTCQIKNLPTDLIHATYLHGGGSGLAAVIRSQPDGACFGLCVADRDTDPFDPNAPMKPGGTAYMAHGASVGCNLLCDKEFGHSSTVPFFGFLLTGARTIEGCIGPHTLENYFSNNPHSREAEQIFRDAFRAFPSLSTDEWKLWSLLDFKKGGVGLDSIMISLEKAGLSQNAFSAMQIARADIAVMPKDVSQWLWSQSLATRSSQSIKRAFEKDCDEPYYWQSVHELWQMTWDFLAADHRVMLS